MAKLYRAVKAALNIGDDYDPRTGWNWYLYHHI
jgi:hypothetical protein